MNWYQMAWLALAAVGVVYLDIIAGRLRTIQEVLRQIPSRMPTRCSAGVGDISERLQTLVAAQRETNAILEEMLAPVREQEERQRWADLGLSYDLDGPGRLAVHPTAAA